MEPTFEQDKLDELTAEIATELADLPREKLYEMIGRLRWTNNMLARLMAQQSKITQVHILKESGFSTAKIAAQLDISESSLQNLLDNDVTKPKPAVESQS